MTPLAKRQLEQCNFDCLESDTFLPLQEVVHYLFYHRWWSEEDIRENIEGLERVNVKRMLRHPYTCNHSRKK